MEFVLEFLMHAVGWIIGEAAMGFFDTFELGWHLVLAALEIVAGLVFGVYLTQSLGPVEASGALVGLGMVTVPALVGLGFGTVAGLFHSPFRFSLGWAVHPCLVVFAIGLGAVMA